MMKHANRPGMRPTLGGQPDLAGRLLRRSTILDGTVKVAYGPGQYPNSVPIDTSGDDGSDYDPPTDWPPVGMLARTPQVVWLSAYFPFATQTVRERLDGVRHRFWTGHDFGDGAGPYFDFYTTWVLSTDYDHATGPHPTKAEHDRLFAAFRDAKARVESLRPGRTYVEVYDWYAPDTAEKFSVPNLWYHLTCPAAGWRFYGTDFLHVYCGHFGVNADASSSSSWDFTDLADNDQHRAAVDRVRANAAKFAGFAVQLFTYEKTGASGYDPPLPDYEGRFSGPTGDPYILVTPSQYIAMWRQVSADADAQNISWAQAWLDDIGRNTVIETDAAGKSPIDALRAQSESTTALNQETIAAANDGPSQQAALTSSVYRDSVSVLNADDNDYGVAIAGDTTDLDADAVVALIADHYGFDPNTGKDLPPSQLG